MKKQQKQELKANLQKIENVLNDHEEWEHYYDYSLVLHKSEILFDISVEDDDMESYGIEIADTDKTDIKSICKMLVNYLYENEIDRRQKFINDAKNFNNRKIKSLCLWSKRCNEKKIKQITEDLTYHYKEIQECKNELAEYKEYIRDIYKVLWELCPNFKVEDIKEYCIERFKHFNIKDVEITIEDNKIIASYTSEFRSYDFKVDIDSFSRNDNVFRKLNNKIRTIQELEEAAC